MNSNRKKYASTPTYGMQKRSFAKKQASAQPTPTPDFTQQPGLDASVPVTPFNPQNTYLPPQGSFTGTVPQPGASPFYPNPSAAPQGVAPGTGAFAPGQAPGGPVSYPPQNANTPNFSQPLGNSMPPMQQSGFLPRAQGFVPPSFAQQGGAQVPQNAAAGAQMPGMNAGVAPGAYCPMPGMNGANVQNLGPAANPYAGMGYPGAAASYGGVPYNGTSYAANAGMPNTGMPGAAGAPNTAGVPNVSGAPGISGVPNMMNAGSGGNGGGFASQPYPGQGGGAARPTPKPPTDFDKVLKVLLYGVLPVLFVPCVFVTHTFDFLRYLFIYLFIILTVITLSVLWYRQSFSSGLRTTLSVIYLALSIVVIAFLVSTDQDVTRTSGSVNAAGNAQTTVETQVTPTVTPEAQETPAPTEDTTASEAEARLSTFMDYWSVNNFEEMVNLVSPAWTAKQDAPAQALFMIISNRTPLNYTIESISGTAGDSSRTVTMSVDIDKNNGKDPTRYRFMILMINTDSEWYVDPNSLASNDEEEATATPAPGQTTISQSLAPRMTVTPIPAADTKLYYNANGGRYYHLDPNCDKVNSKYLPMTAFLYSELDDAPYSSLLPCLKCGAPTQSLGDLAAEATDTPAP